MKTIATVFRKEWIDTLRDRRTLFFMVVIPLLLFPVLFKIMFSMQESHESKAQHEALRVACIAHGNAADFVDTLAARNDFTMVTDVPEDSVASYVRRGRLDGAFVFDSDFDAELAELSPGRVAFYYRGTEDDRIKRTRMRRLLDGYEKRILSARFRKLDLDPDIVDGIDTRSHDVSSLQEKVGSQIGGFLPYIFILFCFMGAMNPAIDLGAGEKERGTIETLLTAPVNRLHILLGKFGVVVVSGVISAILGIAGLAIGFKQAVNLPPEFVSAVVKILGGHTIVLLLTLLVPLTVFFAGLLLSVSMTARTFKEAQSLIAPLNIAIIVPAAIGMMPGFHLSYGTALIPIVNVSLATKAIMSGSISAPLLAVVYASLAVFALLSLWGASWWFGREATIFRS